ncbi:MAG: hypothetical protein JWL61_4869 [Gemmatimonadetes bacterium]|nr:hypothetical protein [Gemmatimonadota bacterium]
MPVSHSIDTEHQLVYAVFSGDVSDADFIEHLKSLFGDPRFDSSMSELVDLREVTEVSLSPDMIASSARWPLHSPHARRAVVAPSDFLFGLSRMYESYRGEAGADQFRIFRTLPPALEWLGLSTEPPRP